MSEPVYTIILHGNDATGKSTLAPALRAAGEVVYARGDEDPALEDVLVVRSFDKFTLHLADDDRAPLPESYTDKDGVHRRIVRIILDADLSVLRGGSRTGQARTSGSLKRRSSISARGFSYVFFILLAQNTTLTRH